jgi:hypothetical protein
VAAAAPLPLPLLTMADQTMQPTVLSLWLRPSTERSRPTA